MSLTCVDYFLLVILWTWPSFSIQIMNFKQKRLFTIYNYNSIWNIQDSEIVSYLIVEHGFFRKVFSFVVRVGVLRQTGSAKIVIFNWILSFWKWIDKNIEENLITI